MLNLKDRENRKEILAVLALFVAIGGFSHALGYWPHGNPVSTPPSPNAQEYNAFMTADTVWKLVYLASLLSVGLLYYLGRRHTALSAPAHGGAAAQTVALQQQIEQWRKQWEDERGGSSARDQKIEQLKEQLAAAQQAAPRGLGLLRIYKAVYGPGDYRDVDVTETLKQYVGSALAVSIDNHTLGRDPAPGLAKRLKVHYVYGESELRIISRPEYGLLVLPEDLTQKDTSPARESSIIFHPSLSEIGTRIESAAFGSARKPPRIITAKIEALVASGETDIPANHYKLCDGQDPDEGEEKFLTITVSNTVRQTGRLTLPLSWPVSMAVAPEPGGPVLIVECGPEPKTGFGHGLILRTHGEPVFNVRISEISNGHQRAVFTEEIPVVTTEPTWVAPQVHSLDPGFTSRNLVNAISQEGEDSPTTFSVSYNRFQGKPARLIGKYTITKTWISDQVTVRFSDLSSESDIKTERRLGALAPILESEGPGNVQLGLWGFKTLYILGIKNSQVALDSIARNVTAKVEYRHADNLDVFTVEPCGWFLGMPPLGMHTAPDIRSGEMIKLILALRSDQDNDTHVTAFSQTSCYAGRTLKYGKWTATVMLSGHNCESLSVVTKFGIDRDGSLYGLKQV